MKYMRLILFVFLMIAISCTSKQPVIHINSSFCLSNSAAAIKRAEKEWLRIYGNHIYKMEPFKASLKNDTIWVVKGTLEKGMRGGVPYAEINAKNCQIIMVTHGK
jgi:hypothetical protein